MKRLWDSANRPRSAPSICPRTDFCDNPAGIASATDDSASRRCTTEVGPVLETTRTVRWDKAAAALPGRLSCCCSTGRCLALVFVASIAAAPADRSGLSSVDDRSTCRSDSRPDSCRAEEDSRSSPRTSQVSRAVASSVRPAQVTFASSSAACSSGHSVGCTVRAAAVAAEASNCIAAGAEAAALARQNRSGSTDG